MERTVKEIVSLIVSWRWKLLYEITDGFESNQSLIFDGKSSWEMLFSEIKLVLSFDPNSIVSSRAFCDKEKKVNECLIELKEFMRLDPTALTERSCRIIRVLIQRLDEEKRKRTCHPIVLGTALKRW